MSGFDFGIEIPPGSPDELRSKANQFRDLAERLDTVLRSGVVSRERLAIYWKGSAATSYQQSGALFENGLHILVGHLDEAAYALGAYASQLESAQEGARSAIRAAQFAEDEWLGAQRWHEAAIAAATVGPVATLAIVAIEQQFTAARDLYLVGLSRARDLGEEEMHSASRAVAALAVTLGQGVERVPGLLGLLGRGLVGANTLVNRAYLVDTFGEKFNALETWFQTEGQLSTAKTAYLAADNAFTTLSDAGADPEAILNAEKAMAEATQALASTSTDFTAATGSVKEAFVAPGVRAMSWIGAKFGNSDGIVGRAASWIGDSADTAGKIFPFLGLLALPQDYFMVTNPGQPGAWGVGDRVAGGLGAVAAVGLVVVQFIPGLDVGVDAAIGLGLGAVMLGTTAYEGVDWAAHHWSTIEHVAGDVGSFSEHAAENIVNANVQGIRDVIHAGGDVATSAAKDVSSSVNAMVGGAGSVVSGAMNVAKDLNPFSW
ncbi:MAG: WXG100 family type VII secretion target [Ferrimicrobium sp.]